MSLTRAFHSLKVLELLRRSGRFLIVFALAAIALVALPSAPALATNSVSPFVCGSNTIYNIDGDSRAITKITTTTAATAANGTFDGSGDRLNALALPNGGGRYIYAFDRTDNTVVRFDANSGTTAVYALAANNGAGSVIAGAINPVNGLYYYAVGGSTWTLYAFNTGSNAGIGKVGTISGLGSNGDMAFDALGNLYVVSNDNSSAAGTLARVNAPLPTTAGSTVLTSTGLA